MVLSLEPETQGFQNSGTNFPTLWKCRKQLGFGWKGLLFDRFLVLWPWVASLELESNHPTCPSHTRSSSLIRQLYLDSRVKELLFTPFHFEHGQPLALFPVAHLGLGSFSTAILHTVHQPRVMPGVCRAAPVQAWFEAARRLSCSYQ